MCTPLRWLYRAIDTILKRTPIVTIGSQGSPRGGAEYDFRALVSLNRLNNKFLINLTCCVSIYDIGLILRFFK